MIDVLSSAPVEGASVAPSYDDVCIDPIFDLSAEAQAAIERRFPADWDPFLLFDDEEGGTDDGPC